LQKDKHGERHKQTCLPERGENFIDRFFDKGGRVVNDFVFQTGGELLGKFFDFADDTFRRRYGIGTGTLEHGEGNCVFVAQIAAHGIVGRTQFNSRNIIKADKAPFFSRFEDDLPKFFCGLQSAECVHIDLKCFFRIWQRLLSYDTGGNLNVLLSHRLNRITGSQIEGCQTFYIQPDSHAVLCPSKNLNVSYAIQA